MLTPPLHELFEARHIAVVGASARMETAGGRVFAALLRRPFAGRLTPVNLRRKTVAGLPAFAHVGQIGEKPDVAVVAVPPQAQAGAVAACAASGVPYVLLLADEGGEPDDEQCAKLFKAAAGGAGKTQLVLCAGDGFNLPHAGLYADCFGGFPAAGRVAVLGRQAGFCGGVLRALAGVPVGFSFTANLLPQSPAAPWLDRFREDSHSRLLVCQYLPQQPAAFFSALRQAAQDKNVVLYAPQSLDAREDALFRALAEYCGALPVRTPQELQAAVRAALLPRRPGQGGVYILSGGESGWLADAAQAAGVRVRLLPALPRRANPLQIRDAAAAALQDDGCRALLLRANDADTAAQLAQLQQSSDTPLYAVLPPDSGAENAFSDGLCAFSGEEEAVRTLAAQAAWQRLHKMRQTTAKPHRPPCLTPDLRQAALLVGRPAGLAAVLHLPPQDAGGFSDGLLSYTVLPHTGAVLEARYNGETRLLLPPFDTRHALLLGRFFAAAALRPALEQLLLSLNAAAYGLSALQSLRIRVDTQNARLCTESLSADADAPPVAPLFAAAPFSDGRFFTAANGETLLVRALLPEDAEALQRFVRGMDEADRRTRFMSHIKELPAGRLARFTLIDHARDCAIAAWRGSGEIAGWAQYACLRFPEACEFGIAVAADMKGQGLAAFLLRQLVAQAGRQSYRAVCAEILADNAAMRALAAKLGFKTAPSPEDARLVAARLALQREKRPKSRLLPNKGLRGGGKTV